MNSGKEKTGNFISPTQKVVDTIKNRLFYNYAPELVVELDVFLENGTKVGGKPYLWSLNHTLNSATNYSQS
jgi:hypothetical protein